jgi:hypothetical protein
VGADTGAPEVGEREVAVVEDEDDVEVDVDDVEVVVVDLVLLQINGICATTVGIGFIRKILVGVLQHLKLPIPAEPSSQQLSMSILLVLYVWCILTIDSYL